MKSMKNIEKNNELDELSLEKQKSSKKMLFYPARSALIAAMLLATVLFTDCADITSGMEPNYITPPDILAAAELTQIPSLENITEKASELSSSGSRAAATVSTTAYTEKTQATLPAGFQPTGQGGFESPNASLVIKAPKETA